MPKKVLVATISNREKIDLSASCIYLVSVGTPNFSPTEDPSDDPVCAAINAISEAGFRHCTILVAGTLQRYNIAADNGTTPEEAFQDAYQKERTWIEQYRSLFQEKLSEKYSISCWGEWILDHRQSQFLERKAEVEKQLQTNCEFSAAMQHSIQEYGKRHAKSIGEPRFQAIQIGFNELCKQYLIEECAAMSLWTELGFNYIVYPGKSTEVLTQARNLFIEPHSANNLQWIAIRFKRVDERPNLSSNPSCLFSRLQPPQIDTISATLCFQITAVINTLPPDSQRKIATFIAATMQSYIRQGHDSKSPFSDVSIERIPTPTNG